MKYFSFIVLVLCMLALFRARNFCKENEHNVFHKKIKQVNGVLYLYKKNLLNHTSSMLERIPNLFNK